MCDAEKIVEIEELEAAAIFGFDGRKLIFKKEKFHFFTIPFKIQCSLGQITCGLKVHPDNKHLIFPIGNKVSIMNLETNKQEFLCGHTNTISTIDVSKT